MSIIRRIKAGRPAGASRRPPRVHMATPVICGTCPWKQQQILLSDYWTGPRFDRWQLYLRYWQMSFATLA